MPERMVGRKEGLIDLAEFHSHVLKKRVDSGRIRATFKGDQGQHLGQMDTYSTRL